MEFVSGKGVGVPCEETFEFLANHSNYHISVEMCTYDGGGGERNEWSAGRE
jgi:hypothetical protein